MAAASSQAKPGLRFKFSPEQALRLEPHVRAALTCALCGAITPSIKVCTYPDKVPLTACAACRRTTLRYYTRTPIRLVELLCETTRVQCYRCHYESTVTNFYHKCFLGTNATPLAEDQNELPQCPDNQQRLPNKALTCCPICEQHHSYHTACSDVWRRRLRQLSARMTITAKQANADLLGTAVSQPVREPASECAVAQKEREPASV